MILDEKFDEVKKKVEDILGQFISEEYGNKLSQFAFLSLKTMILSEMMKLKQEDIGGDKIG